MTEPRRAAQDRPGAGSVASPTARVGQRHDHRPRELREGLDRVRRGREAADAGLTTLPDLGAAQPQEVLNELQRLRPEIARLAAACRTAAAASD